MQLLGTREMKLLVNSIARLARQSSAWLTKVCPIARSKGGAGNSSL